MYVCACDLKFWSCQSHYIFIFKGTHVYLLCAIKMKAWKQLDWLCVPFVTYYNISHHILKAQVLWVINNMINLYWGQPRLFYIRSRPRGTFTRMAVEWHVITDIHGLHGLTLFKLKLVKVIKHTHTHINAHAHTHTHTLHYIYLYEKYVP